MTSSDSFPNVKSSPTRKRAVLVLSNELLRQVLQLPDTVRLLAVVSDRGDVELDQSTIVIEGDGLPDNCKWAEGEQPLAVRPEYDQTVTEHRDIVFKGLR